MDMNVVMEFIRPELFILVAFLWCLGLFLKKAPFFQAEWLIPFIILGVSIVVTIAYIAVVCGDGFTANVIVVGIIQAVIIAALSVFGNEVIKQLFSKRDEDTKRW